MKKILLLLIATSSCASLMGMGNQTHIISTQNPPSFDPPPPYATPSAPLASMPEVVQQPNNNAQALQHQPERPTGFKSLTPIGKVCWILAIIPAMVIDTGLCPLMTCGDGCKDTSNSYDEDPEEWDEGAYCLTRRLLGCIDVEEFCCMKTDLRRNARGYPTGF